MTNDPVPLVRHFSIVPESETDSDEQEILSIWSGRERKGWQELEEEEHRCIILAEAGAGKSHEMKVRAEYANERGRAAFCIRVEDIKDDFDGAFLVGNAAAFHDWLSSSEDAWFFLDSVDEARLDNPRKFEMAIRRFAERIKLAQHRARVFISSRPYAWRARSDRKLIEQHLPFKEQVREEPGVHDGLNGERSAGAPPEQDNALRVYQLDPLDEGDIREFAAHRETPDVDKLITELHRANLMQIAGRPFDLDFILLKWKKDQALDGRFELLQHSIDRRLQEIEQDREMRQPLNPEKARRGARLLAAAVILTGEPGIRVPDSPDSEDGIDAVTVLGDDWARHDVQALLERGLFDDALYGAVRFRHREVRELLAAEWIHHQLRNGSSRHVAESLFFRVQYGHSVITPRLRPVLHWLILLDEEFRCKALAISPEIAVEGGDAAHLPLSERQAILHDIVQRIADDANDHSVRDNSAIARIAQPDLADDALRLINFHRDNDEAIFFLGRLVWQGEMGLCVPALTGIAGDPVRGVYARIAAARAVMTCGDWDQKQGLWAQLTASPEALPRRLLAEVVNCADPDMVSVDLLLASLDKLEAHNRYEVTGLRLSLNGFIDRLPVQCSKDEPEPLAKFVSGLNELLGRKPHIEQVECHLSEEFAWLLGPASHAVERLVDARSATALSSDALAVMQKVPVARLWGVGDFHEHEDLLRELVPAWTELNDALFWHSVDTARARQETEKHGLTGFLQVTSYEHYWKFGVERFGDVVEFIRKRDLFDDKHVAFSLAHLLLREADEPDDRLSDLERAVEGYSELTEQLDALMNPKIDQRFIEWEEEEARRKKRRKKEERERSRNRAEWVKRLKATPDFVRHPPGLKPGDFSKDQYHLLVNIERAGLCTSRGDGANWKSLIPEFGKDVAQAYRDAAVAHWRHFTPGLRSEGQNTNEIPYSLNFAMAGLEIEATEVDGFPATIAEAEVRHALRYIVWEINGFPRWLEQLHRTHAELVLDAVLAELHWELAHTEQTKPLHYILHNLFHCAPWMHDFLVQPISDWVERNEILNIDALRHCIDVLMSGGADTKTLSRLAQSKIASNASVEQCALWYALWINVDAEQGISATKKWLKGLPEREASRAAQLFIVQLMDTRPSSGTDHGRRDFRNPKDLKALYILMLQHIRVTDDIERANKGAYAPVLRDHAQDARNALFKMLSETPGKETYVALSDLARDHPVAKYRPWMKELAYKRAEEDADLGQRWSAQQVREHDQRQLMTPMTHQQLFDLTVGRLNDLKDWIERGNDSPYKTWQRAEDEPEVRNLVAGWLNRSSSGRYTIAQEPELPNKQKSDIWIQSPQVASPVPIELKVLDNGWPGPKLCERLRNQLAGDYLREETAGCGVFLLVWQGRSKSRNWNIDGKRVALPELCAALDRYWDTVSDKFTNVVSIEVILVDLTVRDAHSTE